MNTRLIRILAALSAVGVLACQQVAAPPPPASPPEILSFTASKTVANAGELITLSFSVESQGSNNTRVQIFDQLGNNLTTSFDQASGSGSAQARVEVNSLYILRVDGPGGRDVGYVQVTVNPDVQSLFLLAVPDTVKPGERVDIIWSAAGARSAVLRETGRNRTISTELASSISDSPVRTVTYQLVVKKPDDSEVTQSVTVKVEPRINELRIDPPVGRPGDKMTITWDTQAADSLELVETTFGRLLQETEASKVRTGFYEFVVPAFVGDAGIVADAGTLPDGGAVDAGVPQAPSVRDGLPLNFTLTARVAASGSAPAMEASKSVAGRIGLGPSIDDFGAPDWATENRPFTISWKTTNAVRVELLATSSSDAPAVIFAPPQGQQVDGEFPTPGINKDTTFTLRAYDFAGIMTSRTVVTKKDLAPTVDCSFASGTVPEVMREALLSWTAANATRFVLRSTQGATFLAVNDATRAQMSRNVEVNVPFTTSFLCEAYNRAGDVAVDSTDNTVTVTTPTVIRASPELSAAGTKVKAEFETGNIPALEATGMPDLSPVALATNPIPFEDISENPLARNLPFGSLAERDEGVMELRVPYGFRFPFLTGLTGTFYVSSNGFLSVRPVAASPRNLELEPAMDTYKGPSVIAPFWDDLELGTQGSVKWYLDDGTFPRRLIVQWTNVQRQGAPDTRLTFQAILSEVGSITFVYKELRGPETNGTSATVGIAGPPGTYVSTLCFGDIGARPCGLKNDDSVTFLSVESPPTRGSLEYTLERSALMGFYSIADDSGRTRIIPLFTSARVFAPGSVVVNEAMPIPAVERELPDGGGILPGVDLGQYIELYNTTDEAVQVRDLEVKGLLNIDGGFSLPNLTIPANGYALLVQSLDSMANGGIDAGQATMWQWPEGFGISGFGDRLDLRIPASPGNPAVALSSLSFVQVTDGGLTGAVPGRSVQPPENIIGTVLNLAPPPCVRRVTFGPAQQLGTPGADNEVCFEYRMQQISGNFEDISGTGKSVIPTGFSQTQNFVAYLMTRNGGYATDGEPIEPFTFFGRPVNRVYVGQAGELHFSAPNSYLYYPYYTAPYPTFFLIPVAPYLAGQYRVQDRSNIFVGRSGSATIIQFHRMDTNQWGYQFSGYTGIGDDISYQVKLFDNGVIEYHYGTMSGGATAQGDRANIWLSRPDGSATLAIARNAQWPAVTPKVLPITSNMGYRFTPVAR